MLQRQLTVIQKVDDFLFHWHAFPIDFWWRKRYNVPFGSRQHREMNFIDMLLEYQEELDINKRISNSNDISDEDYESVGYSDAAGEAMTQEEIDKDFEELDLTQFDEKQEENG